ncbi:MAG: hypothetical protein ACREHV_01335 [Rhizomicrobium sp.]
MSDAVWRLGYQLAGLDPTCQRSGRTIFIRSLGGLGNQIFVYAFAKWLEGELDARTVLFDPGSDQIAGPKTRAAQLQRLFDDISLVRRLPANLINIISLSRKYQASLGRYVLPHFRPSSMEECKAAAARLRSPFAPRWPVFTAYFQHRALVQAGLGELRKSSSAALQRRELSLQQHGRLGAFDFERDCIVHVRRGDCRSIPGFDLLRASYYRHAETVLRRQGLGGGVFFVSDDPAEAALMLDSSGVSATLLPLEDPLDALAVIAHARRKIIANSTLSLWGALLGRTDADVIFPVTWPRGGEENPVLCREQGWTACPG